ncbi:hypothetical protein [Streptomyces sp. 11x1]|uniref:hypothetical protein n=1 Tax=Streptomyces sp. 11x1 TaxID=3038642 RepID=UPI00292CF3D7|nr:hypothetical protein [Streptomyces sp. 11x1]WNZ14151.1 hypothetical protein P8T65_45740 [Streptomyces sp. 11x1]
MTTAPPTPPDTDAVAFVAALRRLKAWSGRSYRQLERRATEAGHTLPYSTAATMLGRDRLPREELVAAFVAACGVRAEEAEAWLDARVAIACGPPAETAVRPRTVAAAPDPRCREVAREGLQSGRARRVWPRRRTFAAAAVAATVLFGGVTATGAFADDVEAEVEQTGTSLYLPRS